MKLEQIKNELKGIHNGASFRIKTEKDIANKKAKDAGVECKKVSTYIVRKGIRYANVYSVKAQVEAGLKELTHELPEGQQWLDDSDKVFIKYTPKSTGVERIYARLYPSAINKAESYYVVGGRILDKEEAVLTGYVNKSSVTDYRKDGEQPVLFNVPIDNIVAIYKKNKE